jgi:predicted dehydrogenase/threonine dehydrogenase-like Zn-dependent dehydrogenase
MKQLWQSISSGNASVVDVPAPVAGRGQILVRTGASLISAGTERMIVEFAGKSLLGKAMSRPDLVKQLVDKARREGWLSAIETARGKLETEMAPGYSNAGVVIEVGEGAEEFRVGDRVACAGGGYASHSEFVRIPRNLAAVIPSGPGFREVPMEEATFATIAAIGLQGIRLAELQLGEVVAVIGLGLIGQIVVQLARAAGCIVVGMDPSADRGRLAEQLNGIRTATCDEEMRVIALEASGGRGADAVLISAATPGDGPVTLAAEIARDRARVVAVGAVGLNLPRKPYYMKELDFRVSRSYGPGRYDPEYEEKGRDYPIGYVRWTEGRNLASILQLLAVGQLNFAPLITHRFSIEQGDRAYELITGKSGEPFLGVILTYPGKAEPLRRVDLSRSAAYSGTPAQKICAGVIGAGNFATAVLLPAMRASGVVELTGICAAGGTSARSAAGKFGFHYCASEPDELLGDDSVNTIVVCTRHASHARQVVAALDAGKNVFCEKPLAVDEDQLAAILDAWDRQQGRLLMVGYNRRFAPLATQLRAFVLESCEPMLMHYRVNAGFIPADHWVHDPEQGGGRILGEVCHFVDFLSFVCGEPVVSVSGCLLPNCGRYREDNLVATLTFANGSLGTITYTAAGDKSFSKERVEVFTQGRVAVLDDFRQLQLVHNGKRKTAKSHLRVDKGHRGEWVALADAVRSGARSPIALEDLLNSTLASIALRRPSPGGCAIPIDTAEFMAAVRARRSEEGK